MTDGQLRYARNGDVRLAYRVFGSSGPFLIWVSGWVLSNVDTIDEPGSPGETRAIPLAYESLAGDPVHDEDFERNQERITSQGHHVAVVSSVLPENTACGATRRVFGCGLTLRTGRRVVIDEAGHNDEVVFARIRTLRDGNREPVASGQLNLAAWPDDDHGRVAVSQGPISNGRGSAAIPPNTLRDLRNGRPTSFTLGRPGDNFFITTLTMPAPLRRSAPAQQLLVPIPVDE